MGRTRRIVNRTRKSIEQLSREDKLELRECLAERGMDARGFAHLLADLVKGYRPVIHDDLEQAESDRPLRFKPNIVELAGEPYVWIDNRSQLKALELLSDLLGWTSPGGVNVNVTAAAAAGGRGEPASLGDLLCTGDQTGSSERVREIVAELPPATRRQLLDELLQPARRVIDVEPEAELAPVEESG